MRSEKGDEKKRESGRQEGKKEAKRVEGNEREEERAGRKHCHFRSILPCLQLFNPL